MAVLLHRLTGHNGKLEVYEDRIIIKRDGFVARLTQGINRGDMTIYIKDILSTEFKEKTGLVGFGGRLGYIRFITAANTREITDLSNIESDPHSITFKSDKRDLAKKVAETVNRLVSEAKQCNGAIKTQPSQADELRKFKQLLDDGLITTDEYEYKKKQILGT